MKTIAALLFILFATAVAKSEPQNASPVELSLSSPTERKQTVDHCIIDVTFHNIGREPVKLLDEFENAPLAVFFAFTFRDGNGVPIPDTIRAAKVDFPRNVKYKTLQPNEEYAVAVRVSKVLPKDMKPGEYTVSAEFATHYGEGNFRGPVSSKPIKVKIDASEAR